MTINEKSRSKSKTNDKVNQEGKSGTLEHSVYAERKIYPSSSIRNPYCLRNIKAKKQKKYKQILRRRFNSRQNVLLRQYYHKGGIKSSSSSNNSSQSSSNQNSDKSSSENSSFQLPPNSSKRVGRWNQEELASLKLSMSIFGDQSWKKIQRFLIQKEKDSKKSRSI